MIVEKDALNSLSKRQLATLVAYVGEESRAFESITRQSLASFCEKTLMKIMNRQVSLNLENPAEAVEYQKYKDDYKHMDGILKKLKKLCEKSA